MLEKQPPPPLADVQDKEESWSLRTGLSHMGGMFLGRLRARPFMTVLVVTAALTLLYMYRYLLHAPMLTLRIYTGGIIAVMVFMGIGWLLFRRRSVRWRTAGALAGGVLILALAWGGKDAHTYAAQAWRYQTLNLVEINQLPTTDHERIWPLHGIYTFARQQMNETETPTRPNLVRVGNNFDWTMAVEPASTWLRYFEPVDEVVSIRSTITSFDLSRGKNAHFETGETLPFSRNIFTCVKRAFWFWNAFTYEPADNVLYLKDDAGKWVQVVPLIRWVGWIFPRPEFGGVYVIDQSGPHSRSRRWLWEAPKRVFQGCGRWISPEEVQKHPFLVGQNIVPYEVSRFMASSIRFQAGLWGPMPWRREGDIRIADLPEDINELPFTLYFNIREGGKAVSSKLYHYFALEPFDPDKQGLAASFWVPADGQGPSYVYRHFQRNESLVGVTAVGGWIRASRRNYDWEANLPVEHRPYIREIADEKGSVKTRMGWLTTVVTVDKQKYREKDSQGYVTGSPEIAITDARHKEVVWVNRQRPEKWPDELRESLGPLWAEESR